ncbi:hypothetical protein AVEN_248522-1 [Araneus ventricosus]|uniref:Uncharacterized protein n=1 Tax=Araneus ventricosus TaxID=182803 RepID=A0A4Y2DXT6_ARAVE|nr:hypothetical protein AVEN_248522-1 [Araneus ventricosus]
MRCEIKNLQDKFKKLRITMNMEIYVTFSSYPRTAILLSNQSVGLGQFMELLKHSYSSKTLWRSSTGIHQGVPLPWLVNTRYIYNDGQCRLYFGRSYRRLDLHVEICSSLLSSTLCTSTISSS